MLSRMRAALVTAFDAPPSFGSFAPPTPSASDVLIRVTASAVSPVVRMQASGALYAAGAPKFPFILGLDGVGRLVDEPSSRVYFAFPSAPYGTLADTVAVPRSNIVAVPDGLSDVDAAALGNPAMASWTALTRRTQLKRGETVLVNGATGAAGRLAVQVAKHLGAGRVIATGRNQQRLEEARALGADELLLLDGSKEDMVGRFRAAIHSSPDGQGGVDVILDYLWGPSAEQLITACINAGSRSGQARRIRYVNIGSSSGPTATLPAVPFRSSRLELLGSGLGSDPDAEQLKSVGEALTAARDRGFKVDTRTARIEDIQHAWSAGAADKDLRLVLTL